MVCFAEYQFYQESVFCLNPVLLKKGRFILKIFVRAGGYRYVNGYTHFVVLMEPQAYSKWINLHSRSQNLLSFFVVYRLSFLVRLMRIGKLIFWHKSQPLHSLNLEVLQRKSNRPTRFFLFSGGKPSIRAKMLNGNLPLHAKFLLSQCH